MTIAIPLIALVVLLVVWAKCCPEIKDPTPRWTRWYFPNVRLESITNEMGKLTVSFQAVAAAAEQAGREITLFGESWAEGGTILDGMVAETWHRDNQ